MHLPVVLDTVVVPLEAEAARAAAPAVLAIEELLGRVVVRHVPFQVVGAGAGVVAAGFEAVVCCRGGSGGRGAGRGG